MWYMNEERELIQKAAREFVETKVSPYIEKMEFEEADSKELVLEAGKLGFHSLALPEQYGGVGADYISYGLFLEEIGRAGVTIGSTMFFPYLFNDMLTFSGNTPEEILEKYVRPTTRGELLSALAATEPTGAVYLEGYQTEYEVVGDEVILNGGKVLITQVDVCDYFLVAAKKKLAEGETFGGTVEWVIVPSNTEGVKVGHIENKLGFNGSHTGQVYFDNVRVPAINVLPQGHTFDIMAFYGPMFLGACETVLEKTIAYLKERVQFGASIWDSHESVRYELARLRIKVDSFRHNVYGYLTEKNAGVVNPVEGFGIKITGTELLEEVAGKCIVLMGGTATIRETGIERFYRDAKVLQIGCYVTPTMLGIISSMM